MDADERPCACSDLMRLRTVLLWLFFLSGVKGLNGPPASAAPADLTQKWGAQSLRPEQPPQTCWIFNEVLSKMVGGGHPGLRPRQPPKKPIWQRDCSGLRPSWPPIQQICRRSSTTLTKYSENNCHTFLFTKSFIVPHQTMVCIVKKKIKKTEKQTNKEITKKQMPDWLNRGKISFCLLFFFFSFFL